MKIKIDQLEISENSYRGLVSIEGKLSERDMMSSWDFSRHVEGEVAKRLVERYLAENSDKILSNVNVQNVVNALVIRVADSLKK